MKRNSGDATVGVTELLVRSTLPNFDEAEALEDRDHLPRLQSREARHG